MATLRNDRGYTARRDALKRKSRKTNAPCHLCGKAIDYGLPYKHAMSFTADHVDAVGTGGHMLGELRPAHRSCNSRRGKKPLSTALKAAEPTTSREW